ncbi:MAG TPA: hypothetical protein VNR36_13265 [Pseudolysinimonas sp.]|nr:hypothetical protein [Pseudolysinimonas sp.]
MQKHRILSLASILAMLLIPALAFLLVAQPQLDAAATADQQRLDMEAQITASAAIVAQLKKDSDNLSELNDDLNALRTSIPFKVDSDGYIDGLDALAKLAKVEISSLTVDESRPYIAATPATDPGAGATDANAGGETDGEASEAVTPPVPVSDPAIVTSPLITSDSFVTVPVTVSVEGTFAQVLKFAQGLQSSPRLFLVTDFDVTSLEGGSEMTANIGGFIYVIPKGVEGNPKPISTTVKQMGPAKTDADQEPDPGSTDEPTTP